MGEQTNSTLPGSILDNLCVNSIRFLSIDAVQKANSGHPGLPMDAAPMAYVLWTRFLKHNPADPNWFNRDRFVLSAGHGAMMLYSLLYLTGYDLPLDQIKQFRQFGSQTPGHPERGRTPGVETTTGPLGQGFGNGVGMAIAEAFLAAHYNRPGFDVINHFTYNIVGDGDLMEGVASEAASLAGQLRLGKLIYFYDDNRVTLSAATDLTFSEDRAKRFEAYGWQVQKIEDANDLAAIDRAIIDARKEITKPSIIMVHSHLGYGSPNKQDTFEAHGSPLGPEEVRLTKQNLGWPLEPDFYVPDQALNHFRSALDRGQKLQAEWDQKFAEYAEKYPDLAGELHRLMEGNLPDDWDKDIPTFTADMKEMATRVALGKTMNASTARLPSLIGGSADLDPSTFTMLNGLGDFESPQEPHDDLQGSAGGDWAYSGRNIHFGVREHAMGSILNGLAVHGAVLPFGATFLVFSDYMRPPMRLAAMMDAHVIYVFTHDSISLGEDGPSHQPVEQLLGLRSIPNMLLIRPADANEAVAAWKIAVEHRGGPVTLVMTRQKVQILDLDHYPHLPLGVKAGGYVLAPVPSAGVRPDISLIATGSEVHLALAARVQLEKEGIHARVVSLPSWHLFEQQPKSYQDEVLPPNLPMLAIEAGVSLGWKPYLGQGTPVIGVDRFGASAPAEVLLREYGFTVEHVASKARQIINEWKERR